MQGMSDVRIKDVYVIKENDKTQRAFWLRVGRAFINQDGSLNVYLDALPPDGRLHIRDPKPKEAVAAERPVETQQTAEMPF